MVMNRSDVIVLLSEGEIFKGAKQTRVVNTSVLVGSNSEISIPVSCVEANRWHYREKEHFEPAVFMMPAELRSKKVHSMLANAPRGYFSGDQYMIWKDIQERLSEDNAYSGTLSIEKHFLSKKERLEEYVANLDFKKFNKSERDLISGAVFLSGKKSNRTRRFR